MLGIRRKPEAIPFLLGLSGEGCWGQILTCSEPAPSCLPPAGQAPNQFAGSAGWLSSTPGPKDREERGKGISGIKGGKIFNKIWVLHALHINTNAQIWRRS